MPRLPAVSVGLVLAFAVAFSLAGAADSADVSGGTLHGKVGPGFSISLVDAQGASVTHLDPGTYEIEVEDESEAHSFHLRGPGVDRHTDIVGTGKETWTVAFVDGTYAYFCDAHVTTMKGSFTVGNAPAPVTPAAPVKLGLTVGPGFTITLKTGAGAAVKSLRRATYSITVRDRSSIHNAHLIAPGGIDRKTGVRYIGTQVWMVKLAKTGTLSYFCDPHSSRLHGSAKVT